MLRQDLDGQRPLPCTQTARSALLVPLRPTSGSVAEGTIEESLVAAPTWALTPGQPRADSPFSGEQGYLMVGRLSARNTPKFQVKRHAHANGPVERAPASLGLPMGPIPLRRCTSGLRDDSRCWSDVLG